MNKVELIRSGRMLNAVALIDLVRTYSITSLRDAKQLVDRFLARDSTVLYFQSDQEEAEFKKAAMRLGVVLD